MSTIAAIATAPGNGGIGVVRVSGPRAKEILGRVFLPHARGFVNFSPWKLHRGVVLDSHDEPLDDVLAVFMPGPKTFTGEDVAEIQCHGGQLVLAEILASVLRLGARQAEPGEFSRRAYLNGRIDLSQAEAVAEMVAAPSREGLRYSLARLEGRIGNLARDIRDRLDNLRAMACIGLDFPDDEIPAMEPAELAAGTSAIIAELDKLLNGAERARFMESGATVALAGRVNAGKSSLLNALAGRERALVTPIPGTTRDFIEVQLNLDGLPCRLVDTAGLGHEPADMVEALGMESGRRIIKEADLVLLALDGSLPQGQYSLQAEREILKLAHPKPVIVVWNKCDLSRPDVFPPDWAHNFPGCVVSAATGENIDTLAQAARSILLGTVAPGPTNGLAPNRRQAMILKEAREELSALLADLDAGQIFECCVSRLDNAASCLDGILGLADHDELLDKIFSNFCIGK